MYARARSGVVATILHMMEGNRPKPPTVVPLTGNLLEHLQRSLLQQQKPGQRGQASQQGPSQAQQQQQQNGQGSHTAISLQILNNPVPRPQSATSRYSYKVKIINPHRKSDIIVRHLHNVNTKLESVNGLRVHLMDQFQKHVPTTATFDVGYFEGKQMAKVWLVTSDDLLKMYELHPNGGEVLLWCDGVGDVGNKCHTSYKRTEEADATSSKRSRQELEVDSVYKELSEKHQQTWDVPRLKLWARCIVSGVHNDYNSPPNCPAFSGTTPKRARKESLSDAISGAAVAIVKALSDSKKETLPAETPQLCSGTLGPAMSPSKAVGLRMKNFEQLRYLQQLYEDNILNEKEYLEQKNNILAALRNIDS